MFRHAYAEQKFCVRFQVFVAGEHFTTGYINFVMPAKIPGMAHVQQFCLEIYLIM